VPLAAGLRQVLHLHRQLRQRQRGPPRPDRDGRGCQRPCPRPRGVGGRGRPGWCQQVHRYPAAGVPLGDRGLLLGPHCRQRGAAAQATRSVAWLPHPVAAPQGAVRCSPRIPTPTITLPRARLVPAGPAARTGLWAHRQGSGELLRRRAPSPRW